MTDVHQHLQSLTDRLEALETKLKHKADRIERLETDLERKDDRIETLESRVEALESRVDDHGERLETEPNREPTDEPREAKLEAALNKADANKQRLRELQARELEKGAHLQTAYVDPMELRTESDHLEKLTKDDGRSYYRLPDAEDPLGRSTPKLAHGDLLPIQQLARMDEDLRRSSTDALPTRLAAKLWTARADPTVGDDPWTEGCKSVDEYVTAGDLKHWIRRQESGISETYAKKLVSRTIDAILELSKNRLAVRKRTQRKNGLEYTERRLILPADAEIPGETTGATPVETTGTTPGETTDATPAETSDSSGDPDTNGDSSDYTTDNDSSDRDTRDTPETADVLG